MKKSKTVFEVNFVEDLIYQGIKFLIYDYFTTNRGEVRKAVLLANITRALKYFYGLVGYNSKTVKTLVDDSLGFIAKSKNFEEATAQILANNSIHSFATAASLELKKK